MQLKKESFCEYGSFHLDPAGLRLTRNGIAGLSLPGRSICFSFWCGTKAACSPPLAFQEEIIETLWPVSSVEAASLTVSISVLRKVLGEKEGNLRYIETIPKRGYRFIASVREVQGTSAILLEEGSFSESRVEPVWLAQLSTRPLPRLTMVEKTGMILPPPLQVQ
jgi:Transcriptional regulatory protein, C terminal